MSARESGLARPPMSPPALGSVSRSAVDPRRARGAKVNEAYSLREIGLRQVVSRALGKHLYYIGAQGRLTAERLKGERSWGSSSACRFGGRGVGEGLANREASCLVEWYLSDATDAHRAGRRTKPMANWSHGEAFTGRRMS